MVLYKSELGGLRELEGGGVRRRWVADVARGDSLSKVKLVEDSGYKEQWTCPCLRRKEGEREEKRREREREGGGKGRQTDKK